MSCRKCLHETETCINCGMEDVCRECNSDVRCVVCDRQYCYSCVEDIICDCVDCENEECQNRNIDYIICKTCLLPGNPCRRPECDRICLSCFTKCRDKFEENVGRYNMCNMCLMFYVEKDNND